MQTEASVSSAELEHLMGFVKPLLVELETVHERRLATEYVLGLVGPSEHKTVEPMVRATRGGERAPSHERRMQEMLVDGRWNHRSLMLLGAERLLRQSPAFTAHTLDDTAILKQGEHSVGVANQYAGCIGGLTNCQAIVTAGVASEHVSSLIAAQLFLPQAWCTPEAEKLRRACRVPSSVRHRTKIQIGLELVEDVRAWGLPRMPWLGDSGYGESVEFRQALADAGETYVVGVTMKLSLWPPGTTFAEQAPPSGRGRPPTRLRADAKPMTVKVLAAALPPTAWQNVLWRHGSRGPPQGRFAAVRVRPARGITRNNHDGTIHPQDMQPEQWLLLHWPEGEAAPTKAWLSNLDASTDIVTLIALARLRWRIERDHEESKGLLGFDHYEGRTWPGLHHHLALVIIAEQFLALERLRPAAKASLVAAAPAAVPP
jgi:SRSO17 transposase